MHRWFDIGVMRIGRQMGGFGSGMPGNWICSGSRLRGRSRRRCEDQRGLAMQCRCSVVRRGDTREGFRHGEAKRCSASASGQDEGEEAERQRAVGRQSLVQVQVQVQASAQTQAPTGRAGPGRGRTGLERAKLNLDWTGPDWTRLD